MILPNLFNAPWEDMALLGSNPSAQGAAIRWKPRREREAIRLSPGEVPNPLPPVAPNAKNPAWDQQPLGAAKRTTGGTYVKISWASSVR